MLEKYWIKCPICNGKTRVQVFYNTVLRNFPLFCPKCKLTHIVDVEKLEIIIKNSEKQTSPMRAAGAWLSTGSLRVLPRRAPGRFQL